ncbi:MAG TPA: tRNA uridine-5-carboxymethylaminomethyl(34) synthesis GTPase MnmE [Dissulfurispiraceae bacterium]|nr:tRNA uridine-5-carboxymethylaminomethyl(34) synthesis GTPase MnmE [Dissulfurispiraceae bacterium]
MNFPDDTIAAVSTPPGEGGIGIVRLSGKDAVSIADRIFVSSKDNNLFRVRSHSLLHGFICDPTTHEKIDEALVTVMRAPMTYTRENIVEINCHGGMLPLGRVLRALISCGARPAEPGEFTRRAFLNGRMDLLQAEAVIDVIKARTDQAERMAMQQLEGRLSAEIINLRDDLTGACALVEAYLDFPEEEVEVPDSTGFMQSLTKISDRLSELSRSFYEGRLLREGAAMAIVGKPNVGKSSLLNTLLKKNRAIVTDLPGTTRDIIEEGLNIGGIPVRIMDTAGIREAHDLAEAEGVKRSLAAIADADIVLAVYDSSSALDYSDRQVIERMKGKKGIMVINKWDKNSREFDTEDPDLKSCPSVKISALRGEGIDHLREIIIASLISNKAVGGQDGQADLLITNARHKQLIDGSLASLTKAMETFERDEPLEVTALFLREALDSLGEIIGAVTTEDILNKIFGEFCIGK